MPPLAVEKTLVGEDPAGVALARPPARSSGLRERRSRGIPWGVKSTIGRRRGMEDDFCVRENLFHLRERGVGDDVLDRIAGEGARELSPRLLDFGRGEECWPRGDAYHFFGCFDGHGGPDAAHHCSRRLHENVRSAFEEELCSMGGESDSDGDLPSVELTGRPSDTISGHSDDGMAWSDGASDDCAPFVVPKGRGADIRRVLHRAFLKTDEEFSCHRLAGSMGTTAVAALVGARSICAANCGDSKAVLYRGGESIPLSMEHKPDRCDEMERIQKAGGKVMFWNGARVMGVLAMSRAIGDLSFRPYVIPDPDVTVVARQPEDEFLILASDGLWDVLSNQAAYSVVMRSLDRARARNLSAKDAAQQAAIALTRTALDKGSRDNITAIVVDLRDG
eukprot:evm.model.scf_620.1 EVM.evm.TU.scf_620.1   scf_620:3707-6245(-)